MSAIDELRKIIDRGKDKFTAQEMVDAFVLVFAYFKEVDDDLAAQVNEIRDTLNEHHAFFEGIDDRHFDLVSKVKELMERVEALEDVAHTPSKFGTVQNDGKPFYMYCMCHEVRPNKEDPSKCSQCGLPYRQEEPTADFVCFDVKSDEPVDSIVTRIFDICKEYKHSGRTTFLVDKVQALAIELAGGEK